LAELPDLWDGCYDGEHRNKLSPADFKRTFCDVCMNANCRNSAGTGMKWSDRMRTQADRLLHNPRFSDPNDPNYRGFASMNFEDRLREALSIQVANRKGDWTVPTDAEIGRAAAELAGYIPPSGFQIETPKLVDEVTTTGLDGVADTPQAPAPTPSPEGLAGISSDVIRYDEISHFEDGPPPVDENGRRYLSNPKDWKVEPEENEVVFHQIPEGEWKIRGDSGTIYTVCLYEGGRFTCSCPSYENPCKHARDISRRLANAPAPSVVAVSPPSFASTTTPVPPRPPSLPGKPEGAPPTFVPKEGRINTGVPDEGIMIGGAPPTPEPKDGPDPWAPPPTRPKERILPVGGKVTFGGGKKKG